MRGLLLFITDIRKCKGKEEELKRIHKELANIRSKFSGKKPLTGYHKKKYICKLLFMFLLGYENEFGRMEAVNLLLSNAYSEKQIGYLFISVVMGHNHDFIPLIINSIRNDLLCSNQFFKNLALQFIANTTSKDVADTLAENVLEVLFSGDTADFVKQTAVLTLLQILRIKPDLTFDDLETKCIINLICHRHLGVVTASASLIDFLAKNLTAKFQSCVPLCIVKLSKIITCSSADLQDYNYHSNAAPWLTVKLLKILQNFSAPRDMGLKSRLKESLHKILDSSLEPPKSKKLEHINAKYAVIFEAISLIIQMKLDVSDCQRASKILGSALNQKDSNIRFMALYLMTQLSSKAKHVAHVKTEWRSVLNVLQNENDITIKKQAVDFLYNICDLSNVKPIVDELQVFLEVETDYSADVVLKAAALAEHFGTNSSWYVDTIFKILQTCGDALDDNIWYTLVKVIAENDKVQEHAAKVSYAVLHQNPCPDVVVKAAGYILGEFGYLIARDPRSSHMNQLHILRLKYSSCSPVVRGILLTTFMKFLNLYPDLKEEIQSILKDRINAQSSNDEIQQRAVEYLKLSEISSNTLLATVLEEMPPTLKSKSAVVEAIDRRESQRFKAGQLERSTSMKNLVKSRSDFCFTPKKSKKASQAVLTKSASHSNLQHASTYSNLQHASTYSNLLVDIYDDAPTSNKALALNTPKTSVVKPPTSRFTSNDTFLHNFLFGESGVIFENSDIRIFVECEFKQHLGRFHMKYINKSPTLLYDFGITGNFACTENKCSIWFKPNQTLLPIDGTMEQDIHLKCLSEFSVKPSITLKYSNSKERRVIILLLPLTLNKFVEPCSMSYEVYMKRWKNFDATGNEVVRELSAKYPMIYGVTRQKLKGFRVFIIENIDSGNFYAAGIFHTREEKVGFLLRLDRFLKVNKYRSTVRSSQPSVGQIISDLISELL